MVYQETLSFDLTRPISEIIVLKPRPLALNTAFIISVPGAKGVEAILKGIPTGMSLWSQKTAYLDQKHHTVLIFQLAGDRVTISGVILMPTPPVPSMRAGPRASADPIALWLELNVAYAGGERETLKVDVTGSLYEVAALAPAEVTFELEKVGLTAMIVRWKAGTGHEDIIIE